MLTVNDLMEMAKLGFIPASAIVGFVAWQIHLRKKKKDLNEKGFSDKKYPTFGGKPR